MQIPNSALHAAQASVSFMPPQAAELIQQDNQTRPLIEPASDAKGAPSQEFGGAKQDTQPELYTRQGLLPVASKTDEATADDAESKTATEDPNAPTKNVAGKELTLEQQEELLHLQQRDQEVRVHEQQHASVGGQHTGSPSYEYETGPDGKQYVVEGSVAVDLSPIAGDPAATIDKMRQVKAAALAPAQPSTADKNAAAAAESHIAQATAELMQANQPKVDETKVNEPKVDEANAADASSTSAPSTSAPSTTAIPPAPTATKSQSAIATDTPTAKDANGQMEHRNQVIAGVYGKAAQAQSQQLLSLA